MRLSAAAIAVLAVLTAVAPAADAFAADRSGTCPGWLGPDEATPFFPDDAFTIQADAEPSVVAGMHNAIFRKDFDLAGKPRRAVLCVAGRQLARAHLNGRIVMEARSASLPECTPRFADVTSEVQRGRNVLALTVHSEWGVLAYAQLRLEYPGGRFDDVITDESWQWHVAPCRGWPGAVPADGGWKPVKVLDDYYGSLGRASSWYDREFALMPREMLRARLENYTNALRSSWPEDSKGPRSRFRAEYVNEEYEPRYAGFLRIEPETGQVVDASGTVRHMLFALYQQVVDGSARNSIFEWDFDLLDEDLALMEKADLHPYIRFVEWDKLLDATGDWRRCPRQPTGTSLPQFTYNYEVFDYVLDRIQAHGRFAVIQGAFVWLADKVVPIPPCYRSRYYLYPEVLEANALAHRKVLARYADRACLAGYMIGEEDLIMDRDLENNHLRAAFADYLRSRYGTLDSLKKTWRHGYDFSDHSEWRRIDRKAEYWVDRPDWMSEYSKDNPVEQVLAPFHPLRDDYWRAVPDWSQIGLPVFPRHHYAEPPYAELVSHRSYNEFTPFDPMWIDYNALREDVLYLNMVNRWVDIVREAAPKQWFFHCNAQDFEPQSAFVQFFRRAELPFDVIGVGSHDWNRNLCEIPPWQRLRKYYKIIASYRPYARSPASLSVGVASGEGEGGREGDEDEMLNYYRAMNFEMIGHGAAFEQCYTWVRMSGADRNRAGRPRLTKVLEWMGRFYRDVQGVSFSLARDVPILIVRNNNLQRSNRCGRDYGNVHGLVGFLGQLNIEFDIAMDQDLVYGQRDRKIDLGNYRMVFLPCIECDYPEPFWEALDNWMSDQLYKGKRALVLGYAGKRTPYLAPTGRFHPTLARWLGADDYAESIDLQEKTDLVWRPLTGRCDGGTIRVNFGESWWDLSPTGVFAAGEPLLLTPDGKAIAIATRYKGNAVFAFGFPLGLAYRLLWGTPAPQEPYDVMAKVYEDLVEAAGIPRPIRAPHNVRVAVSDDKSMILAREWFGIATKDLCTLELPKGAAYEGCELVPQQDGRVLIRATLAPYEGRCFRRVE